MFFDSTQIKSKPFALEDGDSMSSVPGLLLARSRMLFRFLIGQTRLFAALGQRGHDPILIVPVLQVQPHGH